MGLTDKQKAALIAVGEGPGLMPIIHFGKLRALGLVESPTDAGLKAGRGYANAILTPAGLAAIR